MLTQAACGILLEADRVLHKTSQLVKAVDNDFALIVETYHTMALLAVVMVSTSGAECTADKKQTVFLAFD